ncbi:glutamate racemase [soil metagenome]
MLAAASSAPLAVPRVNLESLQRAPIGVFDSGIGGLSVVRALRAKLPAEDIIYFADSAHCPYGARDDQFIQERSVAIAEHLIRSGIKLLVTACNTACAVALEQLRDMFEVAIVGLEPAVKPAVALTRTGRIAVFATPRTIGSPRLAGLVERHASEVDVELVPAPGWVEQVESGIADPQRARALIEPLVKPAVNRGADVLVLGCTHYPFLERLIREAAGDAVEIVDSGAAVARRAHDLLIREDSARPMTAERGTLTLMTTSSNPESVAILASRLLDSTVLLQPADV